MNTHTRPPLPANEAFSIDPHIAAVAVWALRSAGLAPENMTAWEPCAGRGDLLRDLERHGLTIVGTDLLDHHGRDPRIVPGHDVLALDTSVDPRIDLVVTNPPFDHPTCERIIAHLLAHAPHAWLAFFVPVAWPFQYGPERRAIVESGRLHSITGLGRRVFLVPANERGEHKGPPEYDHVWLLFRPVGYCLAWPELRWAPPEKLEIKLTAETRARRNARRKKT